MQNITSESGLRNAILQLEKERAEEGKMLKEQFLYTYESIKPVNLLKSTFREVITSPELKNNMLSTVVGLAAGYISKRLFESVTRSPFKKLIGNAVMLGITNAVAKNPEAVKSLGKRFFNIFRSKPGITIHSS